MSDFSLSLHDAAAVSGFAAPTEDGRSTGHWIGSVLIDRRWNGPRRSANGGYAAGSIARHVDADIVTVVLKRPIPLRRALDVLHDGRGGVTVRARRRVVATAQPGRLVDSPPPRPPSFEEAVAARSAHPLIGVRHPLSDCVVCGPSRIDGMHVTPGPVADRPGELAAPWIVDSRDCYGGFAEYSAVWAALDCTSYPASALEDSVLCLLGTMTAAVERRPRVGEHLVVHAWTREERGRRYETSVAIIDSDGKTVAQADSTWIAVRRQRLARVAY